MSAAEPTDLELLDRALLRLRRFFATPGVVDDEGRPVELSTLLVLGAIGELGATVRELATRLDVAHSTASRFVTRAEQAGMVVRRPSSGDARATTVTPTEEGRALDRRATTFRLRRLADLTAYWPADELRTFAASAGRFAAQAGQDYSGTTDVEHDQGR